MQAELDDLLLLTPVRLWESAVITIKTFQESPWGDSHSCVNVARPSNGDLSASKQNGTKGPLEFEFEFCRRWTSSPRNLLMPKMNSPLGWAPICKLDMAVFVFLFHFLCLFSFFNKAKHFLFFFEVTRHIMLRAHARPHFDSSALCVCPLRALAVCQIGTPTVSR